MSEKMTEQLTDKIKKTEAEWRQQLTPEQYQVARAAAPNPLSPVSTGTSMTTGRTTASAVAPCCLARKQNLIPEPDGRVSSLPPTARTSASTPTPVTA